MDKSGATISFGDRLAWIGLVLVAVLCFTRAMIEHDPFPWWQTDPFVFSPPIVGLTPRDGLLLSLGVVLGACLSLTGHAIGGRGLNWPIVVGVLAGVGVLCYHAWIDIERVVDAASVVAVIASICTASMAHHLAGASKLLLGLLLGFALLLVCVGLNEVFIVHPQTLAGYEQNRDAFLAARGWSDGSFEALAYERRLNNPEPVAWFGLTNVFASFCAGGFASFSFLGFCCRKSRRLISFISFIGSLLLAVGLVLSGSKGGVGAALLGGAIGLGLSYSEWFRSVFSGRTILLLWLAMIGLVVTRGILGERVGELSLLFRWQYLVGSIRAWASSPIIGVGPGQFQLLYAQVKPDLSPEDVASPHNFALYWISTLGLGGVGLLFGVTCQFWRSQSIDTTEPAPRQDLSVSTACKLGAIIIIIPIMIMARTSTPVLSGSMMVALLIGTLLWIGWVMLMLRKAIPVWCVRAAAMLLGLVFLIHASIEVTGSWAVSAPLWGLGIGLGGWSAHEKRSPKGSKSGLLLAFALLGSVAVFTVRWIPINSWERSLHLAAEPASEIALIRSDLNSLERSSDATATIREVTVRLKRLTGRQIADNLDQIIPALNLAEFESRQHSIDHLRTALEARPSHTGTRIALSQQLLWIASVLSSLDNSSTDWVEYWDQAVGLFDVESLDASGHRWAGKVCWERASLAENEADREYWLRKAGSHWKAAFERSPHDLQTAFRLMNLSLSLGEPSEARTWAETAHRLHIQSRLDPLRGLREPDLRRVNQVLE